MRFIGLLMVAGVIGFSNSAEGQDQDLDGGQGVIWVEGGIDSEVPENAIRVRVGSGSPLCRGTLAEDQGKQGDIWRDIGVYFSGVKKCHTMRSKKVNRHQENFYFLVPADTEGEVSTEGMVPEADVDALIAAATVGMVSEADVDAQIAAATAAATVGMVSQADVDALVGEATAQLITEFDVPEGYELRLIPCQGIPGEACYDQCVAKLGGRHEMTRRHNGYYCESECKENCARRGGDLRWINNVWMFP